MRTEPELDVVDPLAAGREALSRGEWEQALAYFEAASERNHSAEAIEAIARHPVATPASWQPGEDVMISLMVPDEKAKVLYGDFKAPKPYIRIIPQPT